MQAQMEEMNALSVGEPEFFDLKQPWLYSPADPRSAWGVSISLGGAAGQENA